MQNYVANSRTREIIYTPPPPFGRGAADGRVGRMAQRADRNPSRSGSGIAQFQLIHIHPFVDGNGWTSRLLSTLCLYRAVYDFKRLFSISEYYDRDRAAFYAAIQGVREQAMDLTEWLDYFVDGLATQTDEVRERGQQVICRDVIARKYGFNRRQALAVGYLLENPAVRIEDLSSCARK